MFEPDNGRPISDENEQKYFIMMMPISAIMYDNEQKKFREITKGIFFGYQIIFCLHQWF
jgi:hypothetical protein